MYISTVKIKNYRSLKDLHLDLDQIFSLILGKNNTGKTSFISLLNTFINEKTFSFNDFNLKFQSDLVELVNKSISIDDYKNQSISLEMLINYDDDDNLSNFSKFILDLDPCIKYIKIKFDYFLKYDSYKQLDTDYKQFVKDIEKKGLEASDERYNLHNFLKSNFKKYFETQIFSIDPLNEENFIEVKASELRQILILKVIKATREVSNDNGSQTLSKLSCKYFNAADEVEEARKDLQIQLMNADKSLDLVYENIFSTIRENFNKFTSGEPNLTIKSFLKENDLLENNTQILYNQGLGILPEEFNGLGYMNFFAILFDLHIQLRDIYRICLENDGKSIVNLLIIEEPEVHTHPQMQYIFIKNIHEMFTNELNKGIKNLQTIITTHSAHIVSQCDFKYIKYFVNINDNIVAKNLNSLKDSISKNIAKDESKKINTEAKRRFNFLKRYLTISTSEIFFADKVIFIEGTTERILLPEMIRKIDKLCSDKEGYKTLSSQHISIIETGAFSHIFRELIDFLNIKALIITDIDSICTSDNRKKVEVQNPTADSTSNASIVNFLGTYNLQEIITKTSAQKNISNKIRIAYQIKDKDYYPRSFEDAFISYNYDFIKSNLENFNSIVNKKKINDSPDFYNIANECISSKSGFACDLLYYNTGWKIPKYIEEGLEWLAQ